MLARLLTGKGSSNTDAIMLDMGQYWMPDIMVSALGQGADLEPIVEGVTEAIRGAGASWISSSAGALRSEGISVPLGRQAVALTHCARRPPAYKSLTLYSVHAQPLYGRSRLWMNHLNLPVTCQKVAKGYFEAPGK